MCIEEKHSVRFVAVLDRHVERMHTIEIVLWVIWIGRLIACEHRPDFIFGLVVLETSTIEHLQTRESVLSVPRTSHD